MSYFFSKADFLLENLEEIMEGEAVDANLFLFPFIFNESLLLFFLISSFILFCMAHLRISIFLSFLLCTLPSNSLLHFFHLLLLWSLKLLLPYLTVVVPTSSEEKNIWETS
jgi:hypothetical protein